MYDRDSSIGGVSEVSICLKKLSGDVSKGKIRGI